MTRQKTMLLLGVIVLAGCASTMTIHQPNDDRLLFTEVEGAGARTIVFLPGLLGTTSYWKAGDLGMLADGNRLLFVDLLGFGQSPWPSIPYTLDVHLDWLRRTLVAHGATEDVVLVAHSFGAVVAAYYAERYPNDVGELVLFGAPVYGSEDEARARVGRMSALAGLLVNNRPVARIVCAIHNVTIPIARRLAPGLRRDLPPAVARDATLHHWPSLDGSVRNVILTRPMSIALRGAKARVTFVYGRQDDVSDPGSVRVLASEVGGTIVETDDEHGSYWKNAGTILEHLLSHEKASKTVKENP